ncbi:MAG TPA: hypothetical protein VG733_20015 [Chthoniobacteraceae bacterium]|nr:hypothetical protein [Chthoniobacteraceae bacterium]
MGLLGFGGKSTVEVRFVNAADGSVIALSNMPPERLPETFAGMATTLDLSGQKWNVVSASPERKEEFTRAGKLTVTLSRVVVVDPQTLLFSLPTISNECGTPAGDAPPGPDVLSIHEDDWRQVEFVSKKLEAEIRAEIADIRRIRLETGEETDLGDGRKGMVFKKLHVRKRIPAPLEGCGLAAGDFAPFLPARTRFQGVGYLRARGIVPRSFGWVTEDLVPVWGVADEAGKAAVFCMHGRPNEGYAATLGAALAGFVEERGLFLVDWCREAMVGDEAGFRAYFA